MRNKERILALAGIFQSASLANSLARGENVNPQAYATSITSIFSLDPNDFKDIFGQPDNLEVGFTLLKSVLSNKNFKDHANTLRYAIGLMQIQSTLSKNEDVLSNLTTRLHQCIGRTEYFDSNIHPSIIANLADIYVDTLGSFRYRIQVKGNPEILQQTTNANKVRAIFLAGVRSAMLWNQMGGRRWQLMLSRKNLMREIDALIC